MKCLLACDRDATSVRNGPTRAFPSRLLHHRRIGRAARPALFLLQPDPRACLFPAVARSREAGMAKATRQGKASAPVEKGTGRPRVFVFAPERPGELSASEKALTAAGIEIAQGSAGWHTPQGNTEGEIVAMARGADAMMGTSIRSTPITRRDHGSRARPAHRRQVHDRLRRRRRRGRHRARRDRHPQPDRGELGRRRRRHHDDDARHAEEGARARRGDESRQVAQRGSAGHLSRLPLPGRISRHHDRHRRARPHRPPAHRIAEAMAGRDPGLRSLLRGRALHAVGRRSAPTWSAC